MAERRDTTLTSDGQQHRRLREVIGRPLTPKALAELQPEAHTLARDLVDGLVDRCRVDAVADLAEVLPATWVPDLLGWPTEGRDRLLGWASDTFDSLGPLNPRTEAAGVGLLEMTGYAQQVATSTPPEGSMAAGTLEAAARGDLDAEQCPMAIMPASAWAWPASRAPPSCPPWPSGSSASSSPALRSAGSTT